jgi:tRNA dimethylallyltransferase
MDAFVSEKPPLLVIAGPTGVGKTAAAVALAARVPLEVVSADSRQVYRGMDVATGKPSGTERRAVVHDLIDVVDPDDRYQAARFRADAIRAIAAIRARGRLPVVVGGTGLYIRALLRGLDPAPPADPAFRAELATVGAHALHDRLAAAAPAMARRLHPNDRVRVVRALELVRAGSALGDEQVRWRGGQPADDVLYVGLTMPREALAERLRARVRGMVEAGLAAEVRALLDRGYDPALPAMRGIGYAQFVEVVQGRMALDEAMRRMERDTLRYARRQRTWFAREPGIRWIDVLAEGGTGAVAARIERMLEQGGFIE